MSQNIKWFIRLVSLIILVSNCSTGKQPMIATDKFTLDQLESQLKIGPILIGEEHTKPFAREAIKELIKRGVVKQLFLELSNLEGETKVDPELGYSMSQLATYLGSVPRTKDKSKENQALIIIDAQEKMSEFFSKRKKNQFQLADLVKLALNQENIAIYYHDSPEGSGGTIIIDGNPESQPYASTTQGIIGRNKDSKAIIKRNNPGAGTVILAGQSHLDGLKLGDAYTLQALLGYKNEAVFDLSDLSENIK